MSTHGQLTLDTGTFIGHLSSLDQPILAFFLSTINCPYGSLARSVAKPLKVPSLARSVPKPLLIELREAGGHQPGTYEPLLIFAADLLLSWL